VFSRSHSPPFTMTERPIPLVTFEQGKTILLSALATPKEKQEVWKEVCQDALVLMEMRIDPWPIVIDSHGVYRWKQDTMISNLTEIAYGQDNMFAQGAEARELQSRQPLNLNLLKVSLANGRFGRLDYLRLHKRLGFSLEGHSDAFSSLEWGESWLEEAETWDPDALD